MVNSVYGALSLARRVKNNALRIRSEPVHDLLRVKNRLGLACPVLLQLARS